MSSVERIVESPAVVPPPQADPTASATTPPDKYQDTWFSVQRGIEAVLRAAIEIQQLFAKSPDERYLEAVVGLQKGAASIVQGGLTLSNYLLRNENLGLSSHDAVVQLALGLSLLRENKLDEALTTLRAAVSQAPDSPEAHKALADALLQVGALSEAADSYRTAIALRGDYPEADNNLAIASLGCYAYAEAKAILDRMLLRDHGLPSDKLPKFVSAPSPADPNEASHTASPFKLTDRRDQIRYLVAKGKMDSSFEALAQRYETLLAEVSSNPERTPYAPLRRDQLEGFSGYYDKLLHYDDAPEVIGSALNQSLDFASLEADYQKRRAIYFDELLSPEALHGLRTFFLDSTVFFRHSEAGFVGSYVTDGLNCSLIFQVIRELTEQFPRILENRPLNNMWCYRYCSKGVGVRPHNGDGSVTFNFWLTPDEHNLGAPGAGGMVMYNKEHPAKWDWLTFNMHKDDSSIQAQIAEYLADAESFTIPYRCNRAVLFHSTLFHKTDPFHFKDSYESRRMNITMLFGRRGQESAKLR